MINDLQQISQDVAAMATVDVELRKRGLSSIGWS